MEADKPANQITVQELDALNQEIFMQRGQIETIKAALADENEKLVSLEAKAVAYLKELGRSNYKSDAGSISIQDVWSVKLPATDEDRAAFFSHLKEKGIFDRMISVNANTLKSWYMEEWEIAKEAGQGMDFSVPGIPEPKLFEKLYVRKGKLE